MKGNMRRKEEWARLAGRGDGGGGGVGGGKGGKLKKNINHSEEMAGLAGRGGERLASGEAAS